MLEELLRIKRIRERDAEAAVHLAERKLAEAHEAVRAAEKAASDHHEFRLKEEIRLFEEIRGASIHVRDFDDMKHAIAILRQKEADLEETIAEKTKAIAPAEEALQAAKETYREAKVGTMKFEELVNLERAEAEKAAIFREDAETEEVVEAVVGTAIANGS